MGFFINFILSDNLKKPFKIKFYHFEIPCQARNDRMIVSPQSIDPKMDILMLRAESTQYGYNNPFVESFFTIDSNFGGFNPNGF